jgi:hypothetical protein
MIQNINAHIDQYEALIRRPFAWEVLGLKSWGLIKNDVIKYIEVDSLNNPTGREKLGVVKFVGSNEVVYKDKLQTVYYCDKIQEEIGNAIVGVSLIVG